MAMPRGSLVDKPVTEWCRSLDALSKALCSIDLEVWAHIRRFANAAPKVIGRSIGTETTTGREFILFSQYFFFRAQTSKLKKAPTRDFLQHAILCYAFLA
jgi:hypothetical protein